MRKVKFKSKTHYFRVEDDHEIAEREAIEFVKEIRTSGKNIYTNRDLNQYILSHGNLQRYPHIIGNLEMSNSKKSWTYKGGISPRWYKFACIQLGIGENGSDAIPGEFTPYSELRKSKFRN